jgi:hypothetical protein
MDKRSSARSNMGMEITWPNRSGVGAKNTTLQFADIDGKHL